MAVTAVSNTESYAAAALAQESKQLDKNAFLQLLITEMKHQDPMSPMDNKDSIAQLAQFSSLEQMQQLNASFASVGKSSQTSQAFSMTGKWVDYVAADGSVVTGRVGTVTLEDGVPMLSIGGDSVAIDSITKAYTGAEAFGKDQSSTQALDLLGKQVQYIDYSTGRTSIGAADSVSFADGWPTLNIDGHAVGLADILNIYGAVGAGSGDGLSATAAAMLGRKVDYLEDGVVITGTVRSYDSGPSGPTLNIDNKEIDLADVVKVYQRQKTT